MFVAVRSEEARFLNSNYGLNQRIGELVVSGLKPLFLCSHCAAVSIAQADNGEGSEEEEHTGESGAEKSQEQRMLVRAGGFDEDWHCDCRPLCLRSTA